MVIIRSVGEDARQKTQSLFRRASIVRAGSGTGTILLSQVTFLLAHIANSGPVPLSRSTLKPMVETIDKHGLKTKFLSKHKKNAGAFLDWIARRDVTSEVAQGYKTRIENYGERLFTLLDYDGVPWNNNNAENALKLVASRSRLFGTSVSEAGLKDFLVFLSIDQTLTRKGISLLRFLLSGETDLEKFVASYRRR